MSHPAASIKSIYSGKVNVSDMDNDNMSRADVSPEYGPRHPMHLEDLDDSCSERSYTKESAIYGKEEGTNLYGKDGFPLKEVTSNSDNFSVTSRNLRIMAIQKGTTGLTNLPSSSTNISLASSGSDYQQVYIPDLDGYNSDSSQAGIAGSDSFSRPLSRNSNISNFSTTATKDGVEGKRWVHGLTPYMSQGTSGALHQQQQHQRGQALSLDSSNLFSFGDKRPVAAAEIDALGLPPVTLREKIGMLDRDAD